MTIAPPLGEHPVDGELSPLQQRYLRLLVGAVTRTITGPDYWLLNARTKGQRIWLDPAQRLLGKARLAVVATENYTVGDARQEAIAVSPADADSMLGERRMTHVVRMLTALHADGVPGDFVEAGCWRAGATIVMRGFLDAVDDVERDVWAFDSFAGYPKPERGAGRHLRSLYRRKARVFDVSLEQVQERVARYGLLDERLHLVKGWAEQALPQVGAEQVSLIKVDIDVTAATLETLRWAWPRMPDGALVYCGNGRTASSREAIDQFRSEVGDEAGPLRWVPQQDPLAVWWCKNPRPDSVVAALPGEVVA